MKMKANVNGVHVHWERGWQCRKAIPVIFIVQSLWHKVSKPGIYRLRISPPYPGRRAPIRAVTEDRARAGRFTPALWRNGDGGGGGIIWRRRCTTNASLIRHTTGNWRQHDVSGPHGTKLSDQRGDPVQLHPSDCRLAPGRLPWRIADDYKADPSNIFTRYEWEDVMLRTEDSQLFV